MDNGSDIFCIYGVVMTRKEFMTYLDSLILESVRIRDTSNNGFLFSEDSDTWEMWDSVYHSLVDAREVLDKD